MALVAKQTLFSVDDRSLDLKFPVQINCYTPDLKISALTLKLRMYIGGWDLNLATIVLILWSST